MIRTVFFDFGSIFSADSKPRPGADAFIRSCAKRFPLLAMTCGSYAAAENSLKNAGVASFFLDILSAAEVAHRKPAPDLLLATLGRIGFRLRDRNPIEPRQCLVIESSAHGIEAARRAGMRSLAIANSAVNADFVRESFTGIDLDEILRACAA